MGTERVTRTINKETARSEVNIVGEPVLSVKITPSRSGSPGGNLNNLNIFR